MFHQEFIRFIATGPDRHTIQVGNRIEEFYPPSDRTVSLTGPEDISASLTLTTQDEAAVATYADTRLSGLYRLRLEGNTERVFAVNIPEAAPGGGGSESDLPRIDAG